MAGGKSASQDYIAVGYQAFWDDAGDKGVIDAVVKIAKEIDRILSESVNFAKTLELTAKLADSFEKIAKSSDKVADSFKKNKKGTDDQEKSLEKLIAKYRELDKAISGQRPASLYHAGQEIAGRVAAINTLKKALKLDPGNKGLDQEFTKQAHALEAARTQYATLTKETFSFADATEGGVQNSRKFREELARLNKEINRWDKESYGDEGVRRLSEQLKKKQDLYRRAANERVVNEQYSSQIINNIQERLDSFKTKSKAKPGDDSDTAKKMTALQAETNQLEKLAMTYDRLKMKMANLGDSGDDLRIRSRLETTLRRNIEDRIAAGDASSGQLREELASLRKQEVTVEELVDAYKRLKTTITGQVSKTNPLADVRTQLQGTVSALKQLDQIKKVGGSGQNDWADKEIQGILEQQTILKEAQRELAKGVTAEDLAQEKKLAKLKKQEEILEKQTRELQRQKTLQAEGANLGGVGGAKMELDALKAQRAIINKMAKDAGDSSPEYIEKLKKLERAIAQVENKYQLWKKVAKESGQSSGTGMTKEEEALEGIKGKYKMLGEAAGKLGNSTHQLALKKMILKQQLGLLQDVMTKHGRVTERIKAEYDKVGKAIDVLDKKMKVTHNSWGSSFGDLIKRQAEWYGGIMLLTGTIAALGMMMRDAFNFTQDIRDAGAIIGATRAELDKMREAAMSVGNHLTMSASEAAEALKILGQAGLSAKDAIYALDVVAKMMQATGSSAEDVVRSLTTAMEVWNYEGERVADLGNMMAAAMNYSKLEMQDLGVIFNYLASTAEQVGWSFESTAAAAGVLANSGIRTSTIGTALSSAISSLIAPTEKMVGVFRDFGISMEDIDPRTHSFADILDTMNEKGVDAQAIFGAFSKREARLMVSAMGAGADSFREMETRLTSTNALLKTVAESSEGARNQFTILYNTIQNQFNQALTESEGVLADVAKTMRITVLLFGKLIDGAGGLEEKLTKIAKLDIMKWFPGVKAGLDWLGGNSHILDMLIEKLGEANKSMGDQSKNTIDALKKESEAYLVNAETIRQRNFTLSDASSKLDKNVESEEDLRRIRDELISQFPDFIAFIEREGGDVTTLTDNYDKLKDAINRYKVSGIKDLPGQSGGYFATVSQSLDTISNKIDEEKKKYDELIAKAKGAPKSTNPEELKKQEIAIARLEAQMLGSLSKLSADRDSKIREAAQQIDFFLTSGIDTSVLEEQLKKLFSEKDLAAIEKHFGTLRKMRDEEVARQKAQTKIQADEGKKRVDEIKAEYDAKVQVAEEKYAQLKEIIMGSDLPYKERSDKIVQLEREKANEINEINKRSADLQLMTWHNTDIAHTYLTKHGHEIEMDLAKKRMALYEQMYAAAKTQATERMSTLKEEYDWQSAGMEERMKWQEEWFKHENESTSGSIRKTVEFYKSRNREIIKANDEVTKKRIKELSEGHLKGKDFAEMAADVVQESAENQIDAYTDLRDTLMDTYDELSSRLKELKKEGKDLLKDQHDEAEKWNDLRDKMLGGGQGYDQVTDQLDDMEKAIKDSLADGTKEGYEKALELSKNARDKLGSIDIKEIEAKPFSSLAKSEIGSMIDDFQKLGQQASKGLQSINADALASTESGMWRVKREILDVESQIEGLRKKFADAGKIKIELEKMSPEELKQKLGKIDIELQPNLSPQAMKEALDKLQLAADGEGGVTAVPVKPQLDQPAVDGMRQELAAPTANPHTVNADTAAAHAQIEALKATTHSTHVVHVVRVDGGSSVAAVSGYATGGYLGGGWGGGDRLPILAEMGEYITNKFAVKHYGKEFFELLNSRAIPPDVVRELLTPRRGFKDGGLVETAPPSTKGASNEQFTLNLNIGGQAYPLQVQRSSKGVFDQFMDRYEKEKKMRRKK